MLMLRLIRPANRIRTFIGMRSYFIRTRITRIFTIATSTDSCRIPARRLALEQRAEFVNSKALIQ